MNDSSIRRILSYMRDFLAFLIAPKGRTILVIVALVWFGYYLFTGAGSNTNPLRRIENAKSFVWPSGCTEAAVANAYANAIKPGWDADTKFPCACATSENEIKDWHERGLPSRSSGYKFSYYRIQNDAVGIEKRMGLSSNPICFQQTYENRKLYGAENFFEVKTQGSYK